MNRFWSVLFGAVPVLAIGTFCWAMSGTGPMTGVYIPESYSQSGDAIDRIYNFAHGLAVVVLVTTGALMGWAVWRFGQSNGKRQRAIYVQGNWKWELLWTLIPAGMLILLVVYQSQHWSTHRMTRPMQQVAGQTVAVPPFVLVVAKQFGWEFYYPGPDGKIGTPDDLYIENFMVVPVDTDIVVQLNSRDVIHSFFVPQLRLKHDVVPGGDHFVWFRANKTGSVDILCSELCGWGHYQMKARLDIVSGNQYDRWIADLQSEYTGKRSIKNRTEFDDRQLSNRNQPESLPGEVAK